MLGTFGNYGIDFNAGFADTFPVNRPMNIRLADAGICDTTGKLLFYTNGIYVANRLHDSLKNTIDFNPGLYTDHWNSIGLQIQQACLILPFPGSDSLYYIIHESGEYLPIYDAPINLRYSIVDMSLDNGLGAIISNKKNIIAVDDTLIWGRVIACKHANGRDYWVITHNYYSDVFYKLLITPDTILVSNQVIGMPHNLLPNYYGQAVFSPDGSKYALEINDITIQLYNFDRCSGNLSNPLTILKADSSGANALAIIGSAFSASGRYLYLSNDKYIHQYDTWAANVIASDTIVATWDTSYLPSSFFMMQLAPDNRIYISQGVGTYPIDYIEFPDSAGPACNVVQNSFIPPGYNTFTFPNIVNYDLMNDTSSLCDTVLTAGNSSLAREENLIIYPNPAHNYFWINYTISGIERGVFRLLDSVGKEIQVFNLYPHSKSFLIHTETLERGIYFYQFLHGEQFISGKIIIN